MTRRLCEQKTNNLEKIAQMTGKKVIVPIQNGNKRKKRSSEIGFLIGNCRCRQSAIPVNTSASANCNANKQIRCEKEKQRKTVRIV